MIVLRNSHSLSVSRRQLCAGLMQSITRGSRQQLNSLSGSHKLQSWPFRTFQSNQNFSSHLISRKCSSSSASPSTSSSAITGTNIPSSSSQSSTARSIIQHLPPFPVRVALVGSSVGLCTPFFALAGVGRMWYSYMPKSDVGRLIKYALGIGLGSGGIGLIFKFVIPFLQNNSDFILPFALSNAIASSVWYAAGEYFIGLEGMVGVLSISKLFAGQPVTPAVASLFARFFASVPLGGAVIGALTAVTAPFLWPALFRLCWEKDLYTLLLKDDPYWILDLYNWIALPVGVPVGILAGTTLQYALKPAILGTPGVAWTTRSLPLLLGITAASAVYYTTARSFTSDFMWEQRLSHISGKPVSYNVRTSEVRDDGGDASSFAFKKRAVATSIAAYRKWYRIDLNGPDLKPSRLSRGDEITVHCMAERSALFSMLDVLVRLKYLQLKSNAGAAGAGAGTGAGAGAGASAGASAGAGAGAGASAGTTEQADTPLLISRRLYEQQLQELSRQSGLTSSDLLQLLSAVETAVVAQRFESRPPCRESEFASQCLDRNLRIIKNLADKSSMPSASYYFGMLSENLDWVDAELRDKLGYRIVEPGSDEEKKLVTPTTAGTVVNAVADFSSKWSLGNVLLPAGCFLAGTLFAGLFR